MRTDHPKEDPLVELGYEIRDVNYRSLTKAVVYFFVFATLSFAFGMWFYGKANPEKNRHTLANNSKINRPMPGAPNPILQQNVNSKTDLMRMREAEDNRLHGTGPIEGTDRVHIPIERAMELLAERGLPKTGADVPALSQGNTTDGPKTVAPESTVPTTTPETAPSTSEAATPGTTAPGATAPGTGH